jgi:hypothetical protein
VRSLPDGQNAAMASNLTPLPINGEVFFDARDSDKTCRISWHPDQGAFLVSIWRGGTCAATFQLPRADIAGFLGAFITQLSRPDGLEAQTG